MQHVASKQPEHHAACCVNPKLKQQFAKKQQLTTGFRILGLTTHAAFVAFWLRFARRRSISPQASPRQQVISCALPAAAAAGRLIAAWAAEGAPGLFRLKAPVPGLFRLRAPTPPKAKAS